MSDAEDVAARVFHERDAQTAADLGVVLLHSAAGSGERIEACVDVVDRHLADWRGDAAAACIRIESDIFTSPTL